MTTTDSDLTILERLSTLDAMRGRTVHERVRETLRSAVVDGVFPPKYRLRQVEIAAHLGVSVTPVREALRDLASEGLVRMDAHRGAIVEETTWRDFSEIKMLLDMLSHVQARLVVDRITDERIAQLDALQTRIEAAPADYLTLNRRFHDDLVDAAESARVSALNESLQGAAQRVLRTAVGVAPARIHEGIEEHRAILDAIRARDAEALATALIRHRAPTWELAESVMKDLLPDDH